MPLLARGRWIAANIGCSKLVSWLGPSVWLSCVWVTAWASSQSDGPWEWAGSLQEKQVQSCSPCPPRLELRAPHCQRARLPHPHQAPLQVTGRRLWKNVYDELGGSPGSTSAATCTRRHYERWVGAAAVGSPEQAEHAERLGKGSGWRC